MKRCTLLICFFLAYGTTYNQANDYVKILGTDLQVGNLKDYGLSSFERKEPTFSGSPLLWGEWTPGSLKLKGKKEFIQKEYHIIYDCFRKLLYLKLDESEYNVNLEMVDSILLGTTNGLSRNFVTLRNNKGINDLYEILLDSETLSLLLKTEAYIGSQSYSPAFDIGSKKPKLSLKESLYLSRNGELYELTKRRKAFIDKYEKTEELEDIVSYFKEKKVNFKKSEDVRSALLELEYED
ncbi:hypothetical protein [Portibacter lacus]|uniref:Uncharacterized protein n=1 Tax=Portibacter lacus TaxID=1099794 RepID=A0AA37SQ82_9BACT|nr:hypothetical protein [Portibacter lacus]GLR17692.1 hypothetical protein GCM10007940_23070 [Portibacter lacus]